MKVDITSQTKLYGVIGDPISHSLSPVFHNYFLSQRNINGIYIPLKISSNNLASKLKLLKNNFSGFNLTIPHKENIMKYLDEIDDLAMEYGAVNTVKVVDNKLIGYNTDGVGFVKSLEYMKVNLKGKDVLLLGAGGAAKVIALEVVKLGGNLTIANRDIERALQVKNQITKLYDVSINLVKLAELNSSFHVVINSTPIGMYPHINECPISSNLLEGTELVYDLIYNPYETKLLQLASKLGAKTINGLPMLIYQGLKSLEIWTGELATTEEEQVLYNEVKKRITIHRKD